MTSTNETTRLLDSLPKEEQPTSPHYRLDDNNNVETYIKIPTGWKYAGTKSREAHNSKASANKQGVIINLNDIVTFTPNEKGIKLYEEMNDILLQFDFKDVKKPSYENDKQPDGSLKLPLYEFMRVYGPHVGIGFDNPFITVNFNVVKPDWLG